VNDFSFVIVCFSLTLLGLLLTVLEFRRISRSKNSIDLTKGTKSRSTSTRRNPVPAEDLEPRRQAGLAMLLHDSDDGRTLLYVEQSQGTRLAIFDVTNHARIKSAGAVQLNPPGPFDFVSKVGNRAEVVRFRDGKGDAVLDLNKAYAPYLKTAQRLTLQGTAAPLIEDDITAKSQIDPDTRLCRDYQLVETDSLEEFNGVVDAKQIREQVTNRDTGTTFLLTESGLYVQDLRTFPELK